MITSLVIATVGTAACAFLAGWLLGRARARAQLGELLPASRHRQELQALRRRYRRRLRAARDVLVRHKASRDQIRNALREAENRHDVKAELLAVREREAAASQARIATLEEQQQGCERLIAELKAESEKLQRQLDETRNKIASTEHEHGLLRIERDELAARTQRLQALPRPALPAADAEPGEAADDAPAGNARAQMGAMRESLADRDSRIHELECQLRETESRRRELETSLHTWKLRIVPLALQLKKQRARARRLLTTEDPPGASV